MPEYNSQQQMQNAGDSVDSRTIEQGYIDLLTGAIQRFYQEDAEKLFSECPVDERAMVGCIARYVWCDRHRGKFSDLARDVDIEYNKYYGSEDEIQDKIFAQENSCCNKNDCDFYTCCWKVIRQWIRKRHKKRPRCCKSVNRKEYECKFRPDMIVHERGSSEKMGNGMVVEFKKGSAAKDEVAFDIAKLLFCTCKNRNYRYKVGAFVLLKQKKADVFVFVEHDLKEFLSVTFKGKTVFGLKSKMKLNKLCKSKKKEKK